MVTPAIRRRRLDVSVEPELSEVGLLRRQVDVHLRAADVPSCLVADALLVLSELVSNAIEQRPLTPIDVTVEVLDEAVRLVVANARTGSVLPSPEHWAPPGGDSERGRGLHIVASLSDHVAVDTTGTDTRVVCILSRRPSESPSAPDEGH